MRKSGEVSLRRRLQNRLAQRKFRARAKLRKQSLSHTDQPANSETISSDSPNISQIPIQIRHSPNNSLPGVSNFGLSACWGQNIHLPDAYSNNAARLDLFTSAPELLSQSQTLESSHETNIQLHQPQMPRSIWNDRLENSNAIVTDSQPIAKDAPIDTTDGKGTADPESSAKRFRCTPHLQRAADNVENEEDVKENAVTTLLKQKVTLSKEGEELFDKISELYHLGVLLEVMPRDVQFMRLFLSARERFFSALEAPDSLILPTSLGNYADSASSYDSGTE